MPAVGRLPPATQCQSDPRPVRSTVPFFMKEGVDGAARRGNCERVRSTGVVVIKKSDHKTLEKI